MTRRLFRDEDQARTSLTRLARRWVEPDRKALSLPGVSETMAASLVEALRQGAKGAAYDGVLLGRSWGFKLEAIAFPRLYLWHGERDQQVSVAMARALAERLGQCQAAYYPGEGHISMIVNHQEEIVVSLISEE